MKQLVCPVFFAALLSVGCAGCSRSTVVTTPQIYHPEDAYQEYTQRSEKITLSAGDAVEVNERVQMLDPWPPYVGDRRIPTDGQRMAGAVERSRNVSKIGQTPPPLAIQGTSSRGTSGGAGGAAQ